VWFNRKYRRVGPLFAGRFRAEITDREKWVVEVNRYIHLNPVRTSAFGLGKRDAAFSKAGHSVVTEQGKVQERLRHLRNYRWSSGRAYLAEEAAPSWLTIDAVRAQFGGRSRKDQIKAYREALHEAIAEGLNEPPWTSAAGGLILGGKQFVEKMKKKLGRPGRESPSPEALLSVPDLCALRDCYCRRRGEPWEAIRDRHGDPGRDLVLLAARQFGRKTLRELAQEVEVDYGTVSNALYRIRKRMESDLKLQREWNDYCKCINQET
jgi:putative transposase